MQPASANATQISEAAPDEFHLRDFLDVLRRFRGTATVTLLAVVSVLMVLVLATPRVYEAKSRLVIIENDSNLSVDRSAGILISQRTYFETQVEILRSRPVLRDALLELDLVDTDLTRPHPLAAGIRTVLRSVTGASSSAPTTSERIDELASLARIRDVKDTDVVELSVRANQPEIARDLANQIPEVFARHNLELKRQRTTSDRIYLTQRLESTRQSLIDAENELRRFEEKHEANGLEERLKYLSELLIQTEGTLTDVERQSKEVAARLQVTLEQVSSAREGVATAGSETYAALQQQLLELRLRRETLLKRYTENHPTVEGLDKEIRIVRNQVDSMGEAVRAGRSGTLSGMDQVLLQQSRLQQEYEALTTRTASLKALLAHYKKLKEHALSLKSEFQFLRREVEANQKIYDLLLIRQKEASLKEDMQTSDVSVIQASELPREPVTPRPLLSFLLASALGLVLGLGAAFLRDHLDQTVRGRQPLEGLIRLPCLAELPHLADPEADIAHVGGTGALVDHVSSLDPTLSSGSAADGAKLFLVTSATPGEGKTTVATSLATSFALGQARTLLIDCDLRKPGLLGRFGVPDEQPRLEELIEEGSRPLLCDKDLPELTIVGSRGDGQGDTTILRQRRFARLLMELRGQYDRIVIDSPPVTVFGDGLHLASLSDRVLLVARVGHSEIPRVAEATRLLRNVRADLVGFVLNSVARGEDGYGYGYGYRYRQAATPAPPEAPPARASGA